MKTPIRVPLAGPRPSRSGNTRSSRQPAVAPARRLAYRLLLQIAASGAHSDDLLHSPEVDALSVPDRALTTTLVLGSLRWQLALDFRIRPLLARPQATLSPEAAIALRMGAYQLLHLDRVPAHAVLHDAVELVKATPQRGAAGMVNAVLRKIQQSAAGARPSHEPRLAHPSWMVERWVRRYGIEAAEAICRWDQEPSALALRAGAGTELAGIETEPGYFLSRARRVLRGDLSAALRDGRVRIQDEASQLVAELLSAACQDAAPGEPKPRVLDLCAAPGGKTAILAERLPRAEITAVDVSGKRVDRMRETMPRPLLDRMRFEVADAAKTELRPDWDLILVDVPCCGTGTLARNPEIRLRLHEPDLARQHERQVAILRAALRGLRPGGRLVYSTCSIEPEENEQVVAKVLETAEGFALLPVDSILDRLAQSGAVTPQGRERLRTAIVGNFLRTLPGVHPCDGFFAAVVERR